METESIIKSLKERKAALTKELSNVEKALAALAPEKPAPTTKQIRTALPAVRLTLESVVTACRGEFCNAEKVALRLGADTTKVSALLSKAFALGKLEREGTRGSYEYKAPSEPVAGSPAAPNPFTNGGVEAEA